MWEPICDTVLADSVYKAHIDLYRLIPYAGSAYIYVFSSYICYCNGLVGPILMRKVPISMYMRSLSHVYVS